MPDYLIGFGDFVACTYTCWYDTILQIIDEI